LLSSVLRAAGRDRIIGHNPCEGVRLPSIRRKPLDKRTISRTTFIRQLLPAIPDRYRALAALAGGTGLRWGECVGVRLDALDLDGRWVHVRRVAVEVSGNVTSRPYPKTHHGVRSVPIPPFAVELLRDHLRRYPYMPTGEVFANEARGPLRRTLFRSRVWRPALVRAGLLGKVIREDDKTYRAVWQDEHGLEHTAVFRSEARAVREVATDAAGGLTFHHLRHSYATWLVSDGVLVNDVQKLMGHSRASTTLDLYTHFRKTLDPRVTELFADDSLTLDDPDDEDGATGSLEIPVDLRECWWAIQCGDTRIELVTSSVSRHRRPR
jgi:integrase